MTLSFSPRLVIFDLDGTLVDTAPDLAVSVDQMQRALGKPECGETQVRAWIGDGIDTLVRRTLTGAIDGDLPAAQLENAVRVFRDCYRVNNGSLSRPYAGAVELLAQLRARGIALSCVTNKPAAFTEHLLDTCDLSRYLDSIVSGDTLETKKPHPLPLLHACELAEAEPFDALMVGDSRNDVRAARAAGLPVVAVSYGYNSGRPIEEEEPDCVIDALSELPALLALD